MYMDNISHLSVWPIVTLTIVLIHVPAISLQSAHKQLLNK